ncbi:ABC transporter substrate-binding protein [Williamsia sp. CHRR-6]|uniref:ABC transporter substrate-binding protein n=1 Tax=Williamsia sp. CHRR-6 TaxID=2835871 RepID=UPI001BD99CAC|nr:ABC transporter substrate-binding protein [Williamsia sp. CHRR-6]MBT0566955.1 ABC transporter substrate-binding protein [Williamsia sp. CHRR-6]
MSRTTTRIAVLTLGVAMTASMVACSSGDGGTPTLNYYGDASSLGMDKVLASCSAASNGRYTIRGNLLPSDADGQREQLVRRLAAKDSGLDIIGPDVTWTAEFAEAKWIEPLTGERATRATTGVLQPPIDTATWKGKLYAIPKSTNVQLLWYRKSLVPNPPKTWDEMFDQADALRKAGKPHEIGLTAAQYEGYVVAFNTLLSSYGGTVVNADSTRTTLGKPAVQALSLLKRLATSGSANASLSNSQEPEVFAQLQKGQAAFILNWPYVQSAMTTAAETDPQSKKVLDDMAATGYPQAVPGTPAKVTLGGRNLAVSAFSKHKDLAFEAAFCMASADSQRNQATAAGDVPVLKSLFDDPEVQKAFPQYPIILQELNTAVARPISPLYQNISTVISTTLSPPRSINPESTERKLAKSIQQALEGKGILP